MSPSQTFKGRSNNDAKKFKWTDNKSPTKQQNQGHYNQQQNNKGYYDPKDPLGLNKPVTYGEAKTVENMLNIWDGCYDGEIPEDLKARKTEEKEKLILIK